MFKITLLTPKPSLMKPLLLAAIVLLLCLNVLVMGQTYQPPYQQAPTPFNAEVAKPPQSNAVIKYATIDNPLEEARKIYQIYQAYKAIGETASFDKLAIKDSIGQDKTLTSQQKKQLDNELSIIQALISGLDGGSLGIVDLDSLKDKIPTRFVYLSAIEKELTAAMVPVSGSAQAASSVAAGFLGVNQSNLLFGITDWVIKNAKEQMMEAALNQFLADVKAVDIVKTLLPSTFNMLDTRNPTSALTDGQAWKSVFTSDLKAAPLNMADVLVANLDSIKKLSITQKTTLRHMVVAYKSIFKGVQENKTPYLIFRSLANEYRVGSNDSMSMFKQGIMLTDVLLGSFVYETTEGAKPALKFVDPYSFASANNETHTAFFTLMFYRNQNQIVSALKAQDTPSARGSIQKHIGKILVVTQKVGNILDATNTLTQAENLTQTGVALAPAKVNLYIELVLQLTDASIELATEFVPLDSLEKRYYDGMVKPFAKNVMLANQGIATEKYGDVVVAVVNTLNDFAKFDSLHRTLHGDTINTNFSKAAAHINKYGKFMVDILYADSSQAVTQALNQLIPRNQYHLKQNTRFSVSLVAYPGVRFGREWLLLNDREEASLNKDDKCARFIAPTLPIGFEAAWGYAPKRKFIGANGIFIHLIEAGALLNYRLSGTEEVESDPDINFQMIFSPGVYFTTHFKKTPITLGVGYTLTPALRNIQSANLETRTSAHQFGVFLAVDVTAFSFSTSKKPFKKYN